MRKLLVVAAVLALASPAGASLLILFGPNQSVVPLRVAGTKVIVPSSYVDAADSVSATHAAASAVYPATSGRHCLSGVAWSYSASPTGGRMTILDGSNTVFDIVIGAAGYGAIDFPVAKCGNTGTAMTVTVADGGVGIAGTVNILGHWVEAP
jgi:hypothetical protein